MATHTVKAKSRKEMDNVVGHIADCPALLEAHGFYNGDGKSLESAYMMYRALEKKIVSLTVEVDEKKKALFIGRLSGAMAMVDPLGINCDTRRLHSTYDAIATELSAVADDPQYVTSDADWAMLEQPDNSEAYHSARMRHRDQTLAQCDAFQAVWDRHGIKASYLIDCVTRLMGY